MTTAFLDSKWQNDSSEINYGGGKYWQLEDANFWH